jgi:hypothetical protein
VREKVLIIGHLLFVIRVRALVARKETKRKDRPLKDDDREILKLDQLPSIYSQKEYVHAGGLMYIWCLSF